MALVKSLIDDASLELPFDFQLNEHMKRCRFLRSYDVDRYIHNVILSMCLMVQNVKSYDICDVWYKEIPSYGFKFIFFDRKNKAKLRTIFRSFNGAPRALSKDEFAEISVCKGCDANDFRWSLKEYLVKDKRVTEMKSSSKWISQYPVEKIRNDPAFVQNEFSEPLEKLFRIQPKLFPSKVKDKITLTHELLSQFFAHYRKMSRFASDTWDECGLHHGAQLAFQSVSDVTPEVFHFASNSTSVLFMRYEEHVLCTNSLPVIFSVCNDNTTIKQWEYGKNLCTRSGCYGRAVAIASHTSCGNPGVFHDLVTTMASVNWSSFDDIDNWLANELNRIVPVNVPVAEENVQSPWTARYLSRYIVGLICSIGKDIKCSYKLMDSDENVYSTLLLLRNNKGYGILMEINEYDEPSNKVVVANDYRSNFRLVRMNQYIDSDRVSRREVLFIPPEADIQHDDCSDFTEITSQFDWDGIRGHIYDENFEKILCDSISACFDSVEAFLGSRQEFKAFIDGTFHYYETLHPGDGVGIQRTIVTFDIQKRPKHLLTINFLRNWERPMQLINPVDAFDAEIFKIVNIFYEKPYRVCVEDSGLFNIDF